jgi:hypothetical protein
MVKNGNTSLKRTQLVSTLGYTWNLISKKAGIATEEYTVAVFEIEEIRVVPGN